MPQTSLRWSLTRERNGQLSRRISPDVSRGSKPRSASVSTSADDQYVASSPMSHVDAVRAPVLIIAAWSDSTCTMRASSDTWP
jgi:dipeptidyl aminopeptidase/acylaminoacyl peptidase